MNQKKPSILLIYTGGTIGMSLAPDNTEQQIYDLEILLNHVPEIKQLNYHISTYSFTPVIDSSDMCPERWVQMVKIIHERYDDFDGFVILHGTDNMAYTASGLSFMLENLTKPVELTGAQLPIQTLRTDGKENLLSAIEIAAAKNPDGTAKVPEVSIFFENSLMRGNRTSKVNAEDFNAFKSHNYGLLARAGIEIKYVKELISRPDYEKPTIPYYEYDPNVAILTLFPGIQRQVVAALLHTPDLKAVVLKSFGTGNAPHQDWLMNELKEAISRGITIVNITQCSAGTVEMERYAAGKQLAAIGVISGYDITQEAALAKLMFLLGQKMPQEELRKKLQTNLRGEIST